MIHLTSHDITGIKLNSKNIENVYINSRHVWPDSSQPQPTLKNYLCFTGTSPFTFTNGQNNSFDYSYDQQTWTTVSGATITFPLSAQNNKIYLRGTNTKFATSNTVSSHFNITNNTYCSGNIMSIIAGDNFESALTISENYCFLGLFNGCYGLKSLPELPATTLSEYCYRQMFGGCTGLSDISDLELPATILTRGCYSLMFQDCSGLVDAGFTLPALTLTYNVYSAMFRRCSALEFAPDIMATSLEGQSTYQMNSMFDSCSNMVYSPVLRITNISSSRYTYNGLFNGCSSLKFIYALFTSPTLTSNNGGNSFSNWVNGVSATGTFYKNPSADPTYRGTNGIPANWFITNYNQNYELRGQLTVWTENEVQEVEYEEYDEETGELVNVNTVSEETGNYRICVAWGQAIYGSAENDTRGITIIRIDGEPGDYTNPTGYDFQCSSYNEYYGYPDNPDRVSVVVNVQKPGTNINANVTLVCDEGYTSYYEDPGEPDPDEPEEPDPEEEE